MRLAVGLAAVLAALSGLVMAGPAPALAGPLAALAAQHPARASAAAGYLQAWGDDLNGQLGTGATSRSDPPAAVRLPAGVTITAVAAGGKHTLAVTSTGTVLAWGDNFYGQLGDGLPGDSHVPVPVKLPKGTKVTAVAAGDGDSLAVTSTGKLYAWGDNHYGELGDGSTVTVSTPVSVRLPKGVKVVAAGASYNYSLALTSTGRVLTWGYNGSGQLGNGFLTASEIPAWIKLPPGIKVKQVANGGYDGLALTTSGRVYAWGDNRYGQVGDGTRTSRLAPVLVRMPRGVKITAIAGGSQHSLALTSAGRVLAWGLGSFGQLGDGRTANSTVPVYVRVPAGDKIVAISAGGGFSLARTSAGQVLAWGHNTFGQLGDARAASSDLPVLVRIPAGLVALGLAVGPTTRHSLAIVRRADS
jgi:alpha-tubulin suppressor-like RCC1 family protein